MDLVDAAEIIERLQRRAATPTELTALRIARDALLTIVSEGYATIGDRLRTTERMQASGMNGGRPSSGATVLECSPLAGDPRSEVVI
jgi:hypothetical protein